MKNLTHKIGTELCNAWGLDADKVQWIHINIDAREAVRVEVGYAPNSIDDLGCIKKYKLQEEE